MVRQNSLNQQLLVEDTHMEEGSGLEIYQNAAYRLFIEHIPNWPALNVGLNLYILKVSTQWEMNRGQKYEEKISVSDGQKNMRIFFST